MCGSTSVQLLSKLFGTTMSICKKSLFKSSTLTKEFPINIQSNVSYTIRYIYRQTSKIYYFYSQSTITCLSGHEFPDGSAIATMTCDNGQWKPTREKWTTIPDCEGSLKLLLFFFFRYCNNYLYLQLSVILLVRTEEFAYRSMFASVLRNSVDLNVNMVSRR